MSDVNLDFTVNTSNIDITVQPNDITFTPTDINLSISTGGLALPSGLSGQLQYNNGGLFAGVANTSVSAGNLTFTNLANLKINGGSSTYYLQTDGAGTLTWAAGTANITGNGTAAGSNNQIQLSTGTGNFKVGAGFTFDPTSNVLAVPGNVTASNVIATTNVTATTFIGSGANLTNIPASNVVGAVALATYATIANSVAGANVSGFVPNANVANTAFAVAGANVSGTVANANYASYAGNVTVSSQGNITSLGTLTGLSVAGTTSVQQAIEKVTANSTGATGTINYDLLDQAIINKTSNATANFTLNFRGNSTTSLNSIMSIDNSMTCTFINTNGATPYIANVIQIDSVPQIPLWVLPGNVGLGTPSGKDVYNFNIIKTASGVFTVLCSRIGYI